MVNDVCQSEYFRSTELTGKKQIREEVAEFSGKSMANKLIATVESDKQMDRLIA